MMQTIFSMIFIVIIVVALYSPSIMIARNVIKGVEQRELTASEKVLSFIPVYNITLARTALYGGATWMIVLYSITLVFAVITSVLSLSGVDMLMLIAFFMSIGLWVMIIICWFITGFVVQDIGACLGCGMATRIISFLVPPVGEFFVAKASPKLEYDEDDDEDEEDE